MLPAVQPLVEAVIINAGGSTIYLFAQLLVLLFKLFIFINEADNKAKLP